MDVRFPDSQYIHNRRPLFDVCVGRLVRTTTMITPTAPPMIIPTTPPTITPKTTTTPKRDKALITLMIMTKITIMTRMTMTVKRATITKKMVRASNKARFCALTDIWARESRLLV